MFLKRGIFKRLCLILSLAILMSLCLSMSVFAKTKSITAEQSREYAGNQAQADAQLNFYLSNTAGPYAYNDGTYRGTLYFSRYYLDQKILLSDGANPQYYWKWKFVYTGSVTSYVDSKSVTVETDQYYGGYQTAADTMLNTYLANKSNTYSYDNGEFRGTLNYVRYYLADKTPLSQDTGPNAPYLWHWKFVYTGTVNIY